MFRWDLKRCFEYLRWYLFIMFFTLTTIYWGIKYSSSVETPIKIGFVDIQKAARESNAGQSAFEILKKEYDQKQKEIEAQQKEIQTLQNELQQKASILSEEARKAKEELYTKNLKNLKRFVDDSNQELQKREKELLQRIIIDLVKIIDELGKEQQYTIIIERQEGLLYASDKIDLTQEVMKRYNQIKSRL